MTSRAVPRIRQSARTGTPVDPGTGDAAVAHATGRTWKQWVVALDGAGCRDMNHREIAAVLSKRFRVGPWWQQMVAVGYERLCGKRQKHEMPSGFQVSVSRTFPTSMERLRLQWSDGRRRAAWIRAYSLLDSKTANPKCMRFRAADNSTIEVQFVSKGVDRTTVTVQQRKLASASKAAEMKRFWKDALARCSP